MVLRLSKLIAAHTQQRQQTDAQRLAGVGGAERAVKHLQPQHQCLLGTQAYAVLE
jgi:hypothetical protein